MLLLQDFPPSFPSSPNLVFFQRRFRNIYALPLFSSPPFLCPRFLGNCKDAFFLQGLTPEKQFFNFERCCGKRKKNPMSFGPSSEREFIECGRKKLQHNETHVKMMSTQNRYKDVCIFRRGTNKRSYIVRRSIHCPTSLREMNVLEAHSSLKWRRVLLHDRTCPFLWRPASLCCC